MILTFIKMVPYLLKQCVVNSLINNTVDLVSKGEKSQTITLSSPTKALLTSDEIAQITSKGYTIA